VIPSSLKGRAELSVPLLLAVVGVVLAVDAAGLPSVTAAADPIGSRPVPFMVSALLLICAAMLLADILRGGRGEVEGGEDIDLTHPSDWRTIGLLLAAFVANIVLIDRVGWVISGAILFWGSCLALGSRHYVRDAAISVAMSVGTFYGFYVGLGIKLPPGILQGVL
jgi:putative tricarboxylic transport membrane protein